jgi:hypothetical protein
MFTGMTQDYAQEFSPLAGAAGVGHVPAHHDGVERIARMHKVQLCEQPRQTLVAARPRPAAFETKAVAFADDVHVGQMRDAPRAHVFARLIELLEIARLRHRRVGDSPDQRSHREIAGNQHHCVGQGHCRKMLERSHARRAPQQIRMRQDLNQHQQRNAADHCTGDQGRGGTQPRALRFACLRGQQPLGELAKPLAANRISRLHDERIERPEAVLRQAQQLPAANPADSDDNHKQEGRPNPSKRGSKLARKFTEPDRGNDRRDPQRQTRHDDEEGEGDDQLRQADLREQTAGKR